MVQYATRITAHGVSCDLSGGHSHVAGLSGGRRLVDSYSAEPYVELLAAVPSLLRNFLRALASYASKSDEAERQLSSRLACLGQAAVVMCALYQERRLTSDLLGMQTDAHAVVTQVQECCKALIQLDYNGEASSAAVVCQRLDTVHRTFYGMPIAAVI
jgi:hypothetical protein